MAASDADVIVVLDVGKSNAKLTAVAVATGAIVAAKVRPLTSIPGPPYAHLDTTGLWDWLLVSLAEFGRTHSVTAIVPTAHGATFALVEDTKLVLPVLDYEDPGPDQIEAQYAKLRPPFTETYSPPLPGSINFGRGLFWLQQSFPTEFARCQYLLCYTQYWSWLLSGVPALDVCSIGSHSDLWAPQVADFSSLVDRCGWRKLLPPITHPSVPLGPIKPEIAAQTGLPANCQVLCGIHDSNASLLVWSKRDRPYSVVSSGTWVIIFSVGCSLEALNPTRDCAVNVTADRQPIACSRWMGGREYANIIGSTNATITTADILDLSENDLIGPPQGGQGGPFTKASPPRPPHLVQASLVAAATLYCAYMLDLCLDLCLAQGDIIIEGPFANNPILVAILATIRSDQRVLCSRDATGTTRGASQLYLPELPPPAVEVIAPLGSSRKHIMDLRTAWHQLANST